MSARQDRIDSIPKEKFFSLEDLKDEKWVSIKESRGKYELSNYGRVKTGGRTGKDGRILKPKILKVTRSRGKMLVRLNLGSTTHVFNLEELLKEYFPTMTERSLLREKEEAEQKKAREAKRARKKSRYVLYNIYTGEKDYFFSKEDIYKIKNIPIKVIDDMIGKNIVFLNYKIYLKKKGEL